MKVLIADDSKAMRLLVVRTLQGAGLDHLAYVHAGDGFEAFALVASEAPGLVLADWTMPGVDGMDLLRALRGAGNPVPFGFVTAQVSEGRRAEALKAGAQFLVGKPFTAATLGDAVGRYAHG